MNLMEAKYELNKSIKLELNKLENSASIADIVTLPCESIQNSFADIVKKLKNRMDKVFLLNIFLEHIDKSTDLRKEIARYHYLNDEIFKSLEDKEKFDRLVYNLDDTTYSGYLFGFSIIVNHPDNILLEEYIEIWKRALRLIEILPEIALGFLSLLNDFIKESDYKELYKHYESILKELLKLNKDSKLIKKEITDILKELKKISDRKDRLPRELLEEFLQKKTGLSESERNQIILDIEYLKKYPKTYFMFNREMCFKDGVTCQEHIDKRDKIILQELLNNKRHRLSDSEIEENFKEAKNNKYYLLVRGSLIKRR